MRKEIGGYYSYNLYDTCYANNVFSPNSNRKWWSSVPLSMSVTEDVGGAVNDYPCPGDALNIWVNLTQARQALNVPLSSYFFNGDNGEGMHYDMTEKNVLPFYKECIEKNKLRILVYNGDTEYVMLQFMHSTCNYKPEKKIVLIIITSCMTSLFVQILYYVNHPPSIVLVHFIVSSFLKTSHWKSLCDLWVFPLILFY